MKTKSIKTKPDPQLHCIPFDEAVTKMRCLDQLGMKVKYFRIQVVSPTGNKLTLTFDPVKFAKKCK